MKKASIMLLTVLIAFGFVLTGCDDGTNSSTTFVPGSPVQTDANTIVHDNPAITVFGGDAATLNSADGSITLNGGGALSYKFPDMAEGFTTVTIAYTVTVETGQAKTIVKNYETYDDYSGSGNKYPTLATGTDLIYDVSGFPAKGLTLQFNNDGNTDGKFTVKVTKVTFKKLDPSADFIVDLTGKTAKNGTAWAANYQGFVIPLDLPATFDISKYTKYTVQGKFFDSSNAEIAAAYGLGLIKFLKDATGAWDGDNMLKEQYNLGQETVGATYTFTEKPGGLVVQNSSVDVAFIQITEIKFHN